MSDEPVVMFAVSLAASKERFGAGFVFGVGDATFDRPVLAVLFENVAEVFFLKVALAGREIISGSNGDVGSVGHGISGMKEINGHLSNADALTLEPIFDGLARLFLP